MAVMTYKEAYLQQKQTLSELREENRQLQDRNAHLNFEVERLTNQNRSLLERLRNSDKNPSKTMAEAMEVLRMENKRLTQRCKNAESLMKQQKKKLTVPGKKSKRSRQCYARPEMRTKG